MLTFEIANKLDAKVGGSQMTSMQMNNENQTVEIKATINKKSNSLLFFGGERSLRLTFN